MSLLPGETTASPASTAYKARLIASHIAKFRPSPPGHGPPLMVGLQGPQGCGKTTVCEALVAELKRAHKLRTAVLSLDDLYHTNSALRRLAAAHPDVRLLAGRGQPGTHDLDLAVETLAAVSRNQGVHLPVFDKSLCEGQGDRAAQTVRIDGPLDVFILEGWSMGFAPLSEDQLEQAYATQEPTTTTPTSPGAPYFTQHSLDSLKVVNGYLEAVAKAIYPWFTVFVQIEPTTYQDVFKWRLQQEHAMKKANGGRGMTDEQVDGFVQRYMPGYELWKEGIWEDTPWKGKGLKLVYGSDREVVYLDTA
ncbi:hypothetical protein IAU60_003172 [Kwoniella sp. DSM 27419]